jgi:integrase
MAWVEQNKSRGTTMYRGRYRDPLGRPKTAGKSTSKRAAIKMAQDEEHKLRSGTWLDPKAGRITFSEYFEQQWLPNKTGEINTIAKYQMHYDAALKVEFGAMTLNAIMPSTVQGWIKRMERAGVTPVTIGCRFAALQTILAGRKGMSAVRDRLIAFNPCENVQLPHVPRREVTIYTPGEVSRLLEQMDSWWRPIPLLASETGLRWGELMGLQTDDFTLGMKGVTVRRTIIETTRARTGNGTPFLVKEYPKSKRSRVLGLSPAGREAIGNLIAVRKLEPGDRLFSMPARRTGTDGVVKSDDPKRSLVWPTGLPIGRSYFRERIWLRAIEKAKVPARRPHDLRASNISWMLAGGAPVTTVMERVGHTKFTTTQKYSTAMPDTDRRALDALAATQSLYG